MGQFAKRSLPGPKKPKHALPLHEDQHHALSKKQTQKLKPKRTAAAARQQKADSDSELELEDHETEKVVDAKQAARIKKEAILQREELLKEERKSRKRLERKNVHIEDDNDGEDQEMDEEEAKMQGDDVEEEEEEIALDAAELESDDIFATLSTQDQEALRMLNNQNHIQRKTLADTILEKIALAEIKNKNVLLQNQAPAIPANVVDAYTRVGQFLSRYKAGKIPKLFKIVPTLKNWEDILYLTRPEKWTPHATLAATRIFASSLNERMAQRFYNLVLLDHVRADIEENKKLNVQYHEALKKAVYKPGAFNKGIILPLCEAGDCTLREAAMFSSVLTKVSIPPLHGAALLSKIAELPYSGANSIFIRVLLEKKYALALSAVDTVAEHYLRFRNVDKHMTVLWHQGLLALTQGYREDLTRETVIGLLELIKIHWHEGIGPEVRRELITAQQNPNQRRAATDVNMV